MDVTIPLSLSRPALRSTILILFPQFPSSFSGIGRIVVVHSTPGFLLDLD